MSVGKKILVWENNSKRGKMYSFCYDRTQRPSPLPSQNNLPNRKQVTITIYTSIYISILQSINLTILIQISIHISIYKNVIVYLSIHINPLIFLSIHPCIYHSIKSIYTFIYPSIHLSWLSINLFYCHYLSIHPSTSVHLSIHPSIYQSILLSPSLNPSVHLSIHPSIYLSIYLYLPI